MSAAYYSGRIVAGRGHVRGHTATGTYPLNARTDLRRHSISGFMWSTGGAGSLQLALAILADAIGDERALALYQSFRFKIIARLTGDVWMMRRDEVLAVVAELEAERRGVA